MIVSAKGGRKVFFDAVVYYCKFHNINRKKKKTNEVSVTRDNDNRKTPPNHSMSDNRASLFLSKCFTS